MTERTRPWFRPRLDGLAVRVAAFLTLALLPLGLIALHQTREFQQESLERAELSLLALTEQGASGVQQAIEQAMGAGEALGVVADLFGDPATCSEYLGRFVEDRDLYGFVGLIPAEGPVTCSSSEAPIPALDSFPIGELMAERRVQVRPLAADAVPGADVLVVATPLSPPEAGADGFLGYLALAIPRERIATVPFGVAELRPRRLITFDTSGRVLTTRAARSEDVSLGDLLAPGRNLADEAQGRPRLYQATNAMGEPQVYTVTPLVPGVAYAMAIWSPTQAGQGIGRWRGSPLLFPILMWITSLVVAFWAIHRLVIARVKRLGSQMRRFGRDRGLPKRLSGPGAPHELREIEDAFHQMAHSILQDEARMENAFRERGVLLREVHHRVKNNLQLISSIISMQVRRLPEPRTRLILRRLQDRVLTLAAIYRSLYTSPDLGDVNAAPVLRAIVEQELKGDPSRVHATLDFEDLVLDADQVVPLAFLAAEAVSNALARAASAEGPPSVSVTLHREGERAVLRIANSLSGLPAPDEPDHGLGRHLIQAFAAQVEGEIEADQRGGLYYLEVRFPITTEADQSETV